MIWASSGQYTFNKNNIPVFAIYGTKTNKVLILKKDKLGKLIQYSPLKAGDNPDLIKEIFLMDIKVLSGNEKLINKFLGASIDWLEEKGDEEDQKKYLEEKVWIQILEKYEFKKNKNFEEYYIEFGTK